MGNHFSGSRTLVMMTMMEQNISLLCNKRGVVGKKRKELEEGRSYQNRHKSNRQFPSTTTLPQLLSFPSKRTKPKRGIL